MRPLVMAVLAVIVGLFVGFVLFDLAAILLSGHASEAGIGRLLIRLTLVCGGIALIMAILRRGSSQPSHRRNQRSKP